MASVVWAARDRSGQAGAETDLTDLSVGTVGRDSSGASAGS